jgi:hypothetical protein
MGFNKGWRVFGVAFALGYLANTCISPSSPRYHLSALESKVSKTPMKYEMVIGEMQDFSRKMESGLHPQDNLGYVPLSDVRLQVDGDITYLVNEKTREQQPIRDVNGRMIVGNLDNLKDYVEAQESKDSYSSRFFRFFSRVDDSLGNMITGGNYAPERTGK